MATKVECVCCKKEAVVGARMTMSPAGLFCEACMELGRRMFDAMPGFTEDAAGDTAWKHYGDALKGGG